MKVLIADDEPATLIALRKLIQKAGYEPVEASDGREAWAILDADEPPRVAILDWMMPEVDGVELCRRVAERRDAPFVYTILLTSKSEKKDLVYAFEQGACDFHSKPIDAEELRCAVDVGRRLVDLEDANRTYAHEMEQLAQERARQLVHADRLATLGTLAAGVVHEISNPTCGIGGSAQVMQMHWDDMAPHFESGFAAAPEEEREELREYARNFPEIIQAIQESADRITGIIHSMKSFYRRDSETFEDMLLNDCVEDSLRLCNNILKYKMKVETHLGRPLPAIRGNPQQIEQVLVNLVSNAADAMEAEGGGTLRITTVRETDSRNLVVVEDSGPGISDEFARQVFEPFYTTKGTGKGTGLGLWITKGILEKHNGTINLSKSADLGGARFEIRLPISLDFR